MEVDNMMEILTSVSKKRKQNEEYLEEEFFNHYKEKASTTRKMTLLLQQKVLQLQSEAVVQRCSVKKVFLEILENSQEITCARVSFLIKLQA